MMKKTLALSMLLLAVGSDLTAQNISLPIFLEGTWKMENQEIYEHWQLLDNGSLKGESYRMNSGEKVLL